MKKKIITPALLSIFLLSFIPACGLLEDCGTCEMVTEYADGTEERTTPQLLCGDDLADKLDAAPITVDGTTIWWDCY